VVGGRGHTRLLVAGDQRRIEIRRIVLIEDLHRGISCFSSRNLSSPRSFLPLVLLVLLLPLYSAYMLGFSPEAGVGEWFSRVAVGGTRQTGWIGRKSAGHGTSPCALPWLFLFTP
jgi:hypothetical protein